MEILGAVLVLLSIAMGTSRNGRTWMSAQVSTRHGGRLLTVTGVTKTIGGYLGALRSRTHEPKSAARSCILPPTPYTRTPEHQNTRTLATDSAAQNSKKKTKMTKNTTCSIE